MRVALRRLRAGVGLLRRGVDERGAGDGFRPRAERFRRRSARRAISTCSIDMLGRRPARAGQWRAELLCAARRGRAAAHRRACRRRGARHGAADDAIRRRSARRAGGARPGARHPATYRRSAPLSIRAAPGSAREFAMLSLDRLHRRAMKKSRDLAALTPARAPRSAHRLQEGAICGGILRISVRRACEGAPLSATRRPRCRTSSAPSTTWPSRPSCCARSARPTPIVAPASAFAVGWCAHAREGAAVDWKKTEKSLKKLEAFWR